MDEKFRFEYLYPTLDRGRLKSIDWLKDYEKLSLLSSEKKSLQSILIENVEFFYHPKDYNKDWIKENIEKGSCVLANHPEFLPVYIARTARVIMNELLGVGYCDDLCSFDNSESYYMKGKMHLSIFLSVIEQLEKIGVNLAELPVNYSKFVYIYEHMRYENLSDDYDTDRAINRYSSHNFCENLRPLMDRYCHYKNLYDFLNNIKEIVSYTEENSLMPDPETLNFCKNKYFVGEVYDIYLENYDDSLVTGGDEYNQIYEIQQLPEGAMTPVTAYIDKVIEELKLGARMAEKRVAMNYIKAILDKLKTCQSEEKDDLVKRLKEILDSIPLNEQTKEQWYSTLGKEELEDILHYVNTLLENNEKENLQKEINNLKNEIIEKLLKEMEKSSREKKNNNAIIQIKNIMHETELTEENKNMLKRVLGESFDEELEFMNDSSINKKTREELEKEIVELKKSLEEKNKELEELRKIIFDYLDNGGKKPNSLSNHISNEEIRKMLKEYHGKNSSSIMRKWLLIAALSLSVITNAVMLMKNHSQQDSEIVTKSEDSSKLIDNSDGITQPDFNDDIRLGNLNDMLLKPVQPFLKPDREKEDNSTFSQPEVGELPDIEQVKSEICLGRSLELEKAYKYDSIYNQEPIGIASEKGLITAYFPYLHTKNGNVFFPSLRSQEDVIHFIEQHIGHIEEISWKAAFTREIYRKEIESILESGQAIDYRYSTYFIDYVPTFEKEKINIKQ